MELLETPWTATLGDSERPFDLPQIEPSGTIRLTLAGITAPWPNPGKTAFVSTLGLRKKLDPEKDGILVGGLIAQCKQDRWLLDLGNASGVRHADGVLVKGAPRKSLLPGQPFTMTVELHDDGEGRMIGAGWAAGQPMPQSIDRVPLRLVVGQTGTADGAYFAPIGWTFTSLIVEGDFIDAGTVDAPPVTIVLPPPPPPPVTVAPPVAPPDVPVILPPQPPKPTASDQILGLNRQDLIPILRSLLAALESGQQIDLVTILLPILLQRVIGSNPQTGAIISLLLPQLLKR